MYYMILNYVPWFSFSLQNCMRPGHLKEEVTQSVISVVYVKSNVYYFRWEKWMQSGFIEKAYDLSYVCFLWLKFNRLSKNIIKRSVLESVRYTERNKKRITYKINWVIPWLYCNYMMIFNLLVILLTFHIFFTCWLRNDPELHWTDKNSDVI